MDSTPLNKLRPVPLLTSEQAYSGFLYLSKANYDALLKMNSNLQPIYVLLNKFVFPLAFHKDIQDDSLSLSSVQRQFLRISKSDFLELSLYQKPYLKSDEYRLSHVSFEIEIAQGGLSKVELDDKDLEARIRKSFKGVFFTPGQINLIEIEGNSYYIKSNKTQLIDLGSVKQQPTVNQPGILVDETDIELTCKPNQQFKIKSSKSQVISIFRSDFKFEEMGIGGLDKELCDIFRRAFASRRFPPSVLQKYGISHIKGLLLFGPPGTGKTLIARQLAKALRAKEPKIVNGPELMDKYVGETEKKIRDLFSDAKSDQLQYGDESQLHIIIFDEIDAICKQRGTVSSGTGVHDSMVNQLLSMIDGVDALNNILVIGMTNRKDLLDEAILRPGRFEVHIEVGLPDESGRQQIFKIHTATMKKNNLLGPSVDLDKLSKITKNYTGAEIEAVVKSAASWSFNKNMNLMDFSKNVTLSPDHKVEMQDFLLAVEEVKPQFGADTEKFEIFLRNELIRYGPRFDKIQALLQQNIAQVQKGKSSQLHSVLLEGQSGAGKTSLAAWMTLKCDFPYIKLISPDNYVGFTEAGKINSIVKVFDDAYRSSLACIVLDDIERLIEFVDMGPRFSNSILQALLVLIKRLPKKSENKILIIGTTSCAKLLKDLEVTNSFNLVINVPVLNSREEILEILNKYPGDAKQKMEIAGKIDGISIKKLILILDMATHGDNPLTKDEFLNCYDAVVNSNI